MKKRFLTIMLCFAMVFSMLPISPSYASSELSVNICENGNPVDSVSLPQNEKVQLTVVSDEMELTQCQWQIQVNENLWVNIAGAEDKSLDLSYAMVASLLQNDSVEIRCVAVSGGQNAVSEPVTVTVDYSQQADFAGQNTYTPAYDNEASVSVDADVPEENTTWSLRSTTYDLSNDEEAADEPVAPLDDTPSTYNIVINYLFENSEIAADPYTANLAAGSDFSTTVTFPTVQGYLPYLDENQQNSVDLDYTAIAQDYTFNVVYKPTNVDYTVIYYQQNLNDDNYTEVERETKQGLTASTVPDVAKKYEGFYALLYEKPAIAADGSTVVEIYYDRYDDLMNFDLDGGYGVEPIYARYGTPFGDVGTPTKAGYTFEGWSLDGNESSVPDKMPAKNRTYKVIWQPEGTAKVTVVFWGENADDEDYSYIKSSSVYMEPDKEFTYSENGTLICALEEHTHDKPCGYLCGLEEHIHSIENRCYKLTCTKVSHNHTTDRCTLECKHVHTVDCYKTSDKYYSLVETSKPSQTLTDTGNGIYTYTTGYIYKKTHYYLNLGDKWYCVESGWLGGGGDTTQISFECEHTHTDDCYTCGKTAGNHEHSVEAGCYELTCDKDEHSHSETCRYACGKTEHTHTADCYMNGAGLDSNLWTFVKSDTVTVAADGSSVVNVYYDRTEKTLTFKYKYSNRNYQSTETITAKWGSNIAEQYKKIAANAGSTFWSAESGGSGPYTNYFGVMPQTSATYYNRGKSGDEGTMTYWGQDLNGDYTVKLFEVTGVGGYYVTDEDRYEFEGFTYHHGTSNNSSCRGAAFYYTRNSYTLTFNDGYNDVKSESVKYEAPLSSYGTYIPDVPSAYEPGSVTFSGWYLNPECTGAEYKLNEHTMPAENVLLYAKWTPVSHTVKFYVHKDALDEGEKLSTHPDITVPHGSLADPTPADPENGSYTFVGWFYMENGVEKAFDFTNMPVTKDLQVYGKWSSNVLKQYTVLYKIKDTDTEIAMPTLGSGLAGVTKTFEAKGGTELYAAYQEGYFPVVKSHSMTLDIDATNVFIFEYVQKDAVPYTVKYLNKETGAPVATAKTVSNNRKAVVTETFVPVSGMMPDAYQKRLIVSGAEDAVNEIIFYYSEDTTHAYYKITHYTENLATDAQGNPTWTEYASSQIVGKIGETCTANPMTIPGFTYDSTVTGTVVSGELTASGLELKLYYTRNSYPYQVRYLEQGTGKQLADPKNRTGKYGQVVSESAIDIEDYEAVDPTTQTLNIRIEEGTAAKLNIITFYYKEKEVTINYEVVGPQGETNFGRVSPISETLKVLSGEAYGSTATANDGYRFVGWYSDSSCENPLSTDAKYTPSKVEGKNVKATYYAKFEYDVADLTITKTGTESIDENQAFIFWIHGTDSRTSDVGMKVVIKGNGSVTVKDLLIGGYTVTEETGWSWRYTPKDGAVKNVNLVAGGSEVTFENERGKTSTNWKWLNGASYEENKFSKVDVVAGE